MDGAWLSHLTDTPKCRAVQLLARSDNKLDSDCRARGIPSHCPPLLPCSREKDIGGSSFEIFGQLGGFWEWTPFVKQCSACETDWKVVLDSDCTHQCLPNVFFMAWRVLVGSDFPERRVESSLSGTCRFLRSVIDPCPGYPRETLWVSFARGDSAVCTSLETSSLNCHSVLHCVTGASLDSRDFSGFYVTVKMIISQIPQQEIICDLGEGKTSTEMCLVSGWKYGILWRCLLFFKLTYLFIARPIKIPRAGATIEFWRKKYWGIVLTI